jgi:hypothetical protein
MGLINLYSSGGGYLNFSAWFMEHLSIIFQQKNIKLWSKLHLVENETEIVHSVNFSVA